MAKKCVCFQIIASKLYCVLPLNSFLQYINNMIKDLLKKQAHLLPKHFFSPKFHMGSGTNPAAVMLKQDTSTVVAGIVIIKLAGKEERRVKGTCPPI